MRWGIEHWVCNSQILASCKLECYTIPNVFECDSIKSHTKEARQMTERGEKLHGGRKLMKIDAFKQRDGKRAATCQFPAGVVNL